jgi:hypothetical protein
MDYKHPPFENNENNRFADKFKNNHAQLIIFDSSF